MWSKTLVELRAGVWPESCLGVVTRLIFLTSSLLQSPGPLCWVVKCTSEETCLLKSARWPRTGPWTETVQSSLFENYFVPWFCFLWDKYSFLLFTLFTSCVSSSSTSSQVQTLRFLLCLLLALNWGCPFHGFTSRLYGADKSTPLSMAFSSGYPPHSTDWGYTCPIRAAVCTSPTKPMIPLQLLLSWTCIWHSQSTLPFLSFQTPGFLDVKRVFGQDLYGILFPPHHGRAHGRYRWEQVIKIKLLQSTQVLGVKFIAQVTTHRHLHLWFDSSVHSPLLLRGPWFFIGVFILSAIQGMLS